MIVLGFTGTREGMTDRQFYAVKEYIDDLYAEGHKVRGHHGDCIGSDAQFHQIVRRRGGSIALHPPIEVSHRAFCDYDLMFPEREYLERDRDIVDDTATLLATPKLMKEERRSGTWYTVRYAVDHPLPPTVNVFWPDGSVTYNYERIRNGQMA